VSILFIIFYIYYLQVNLKVYIILKEIKFIYKLLLNNYIDYIALGIGDWGLGIGPNPQSPIPNPHLLYIK